MLVQRWCTLACHLHSGYLLACRREDQLQVLQVLVHLGYLVLCFQLRLGQTVTSP